MGELAPHPLSKEEGDARLTVIRQRQRQAAMDRINQQFHDRRD